MKRTTSTRQIFYSVWFLISFVQAAGTELFDDEAYYWVYSKFMDWGYFDHPPMIAVMIKLGTFIFPGELGVRFFVVVIGTLSVYLIEKLTNPANLKYGLITTVSCIYKFFFTNNLFINEKLFTTSIRRDINISSWGVVMLILFLLPVIAWGQYFLLPVQYA